MKKLLTLTVLVALVAAPVGARAACDHWNFVLDLLRAPGGSAPVATDACGNPAWQFMDSVDLTYTPAKYVPMGNYYTSYTNFQQCLHGDSLRIWAGTYFDGLIHYPHVDVNTNGVDPGCGLQWGPATAMMHPSPSSASVVAWKSPVTGKVVVTFDVNPVGSFCGDGVNWFVQAPEATFTGVAANRIAASWRGEPIRVTKDQVLYFGIGPNGYYACDTTAVDISVTCVPGSCQ